MTSFSYWAAKVPEGSFLCSLCFEAKPVDQASVDAEGQLWDTCLDCMGAEQHALLKRHNVKHTYLSTACLHAVDDDRPELHEHCNAMVGFEGAKRPATCKWCDSRCVCDCHREDWNPPT